MLSLQLLALPVELQMERLDRLVDFEMRPGLGEALAVDLMLALLNAAQDATGSHVSIHFQKY